MSREPTVPADEAPDHIRITDKHGVVYVLDDTLIRHPDEDGCRVWTVSIPGHIELPATPEILIGTLPSRTIVRVIFAPTTDPFLTPYADR